MKKLMILGATYTQIPLIEAAKRLGYHTIVASIDGDYPAFQHADEKCVVDILSPDAVLEQAQKLRIDGIATCCMDTGVRAVGRVSEQMGLCGLTEAAADCSNNKLLMKEAFIKGGVHTPAYRKVTNIDELKDVWAQLKHPQILKAVDLQASRGIYVCRSFEELEEAFDNAMKLTRQDFCIVEEFITGIDIGAQAFVYHGEILFVLPHNDEVFTGSANKPIGHSAPLVVPDDVMAETKRQCELAIRAIGLDNCAVNIDLLLSEDGEVYMVELTGRAGATCLPELVMYYYGIDYYEMIAKCAVGDDPKVVFNSRSGKETANASRFLMASQTGVVTEINDGNEDADDIVLKDVYIKVGDHVKTFEDGADRVGQVVVTGETVQECWRRLDEIGEKFAIKVK